MNPTTVEKYKTGARDVEVRLIKWGDEEYGVQIMDGYTNFTTFDVRDVIEGRMKAQFLANCFCKVTTK